MRSNGFAWVGTCQAGPYGNYSPTTPSTVAGSSPEYAAIATALVMSGSGARSFGCRLQSEAAPSCRALSGGKAARVRTAGHVVQGRRYLCRQSLVFDGQGRRQLPGRSGSQ
jgi:hypothetical protein